MSGRGRTYFDQRDRQIHITLADYDDAMAFLNMLPSSDGQTHDLWAVIEKAEADGWPEWQMPPEERR